MNIKRVPISKVALWDENPRNIKKADFERLKRQIQWAKSFVPKTAGEKVIKYAMLKPLIAYPEDGKYIVLGGNMRLRALQSLGEKEVEISIVHPKTKADKIRIALIDNDRAGEYDEQRLAELVFPLLKEINLEDYKIDVGEPLSMKDLLAEYGPDASTKEPVKVPDPLTLTNKQLLEELKKYDNIIVEYSGGKDSTAALLWAQKACKKIGKKFQAVFVETGAEFPDLSSYIARFCLDRSLPLLRLYPSKNIVDHYLKKKEWPDSIFRPCLHTFIVTPIEKHIKTLQGTAIRIRGGRKTQRTGESKSNTIQVMAGDKTIMNPFYSVEETEYQNYIERLKDILWPGYKKGFMRTACWMCPFQTHEQWKAMRAHYPLLWAEMLILTKRIKYPTHKGDSTHKRYRAYWNNLN